MSAQPQVQLSSVAGWRASDVLQALVENVARVLTGKRHVIELAVVAVAAGGHVLIEDVPGVGKTVLARALARSINATFARVQGAPDLLPTDITGTTVYDQRNGEFRFVPGPLFAQVLLVDELNRTTPRTQAALLEGMEEQQVTVDGTTHRLPESHVVVATQNPLDHHGTFPLPESQLDRFMLATKIGYPAATEEAAIVRAQVLEHPLASLESVADVADITRLRHDIRAVTVTDELVDYAVRLVAATRIHEKVALGASPRASVQLIRAAQAYAALEGREHVLPDDVKTLARPVLAHRIALRSSVDGNGPAAVLAQIVASVPVERPQP